MKLSPSQVTTMVVAVCAAAVLAPVGAIAASNVVTIADGDRPGNKISVDSVGRLAVSDGGSGRSLTVDTAGTTLKVDGEVVTAAPDSSWRAVAQEQAPALKDVRVGLTFPRSTPTVLTDLGVFLEDGERSFGVNVFQRQVPGSYTGNCAGASVPGPVSVIWSGFVSEDAPLQQSFTTPLRVKAESGKKACLLVEVDTDGVENYPLFHISASGYTK